jgi:hypothetical protein
MGCTTQIPTTHIIDLIGQNIITLNSSDLVTVYVVASGGTTVINGTDSLITADNTSTTITLTLLN